MEEILKLIDGYGLPLILLIGSLYAIYRFLVFSYMKSKINFQDIMKEQQTIWKK